MAVSKEELLARYKQLKAEGVNITIMELKKQLESEAATSISTEAPKGFAALSAKSATVSSDSVYKSVPTQSTPGFVSSFNPTADLVPSPMPSPEPTVTNYSQSNQDYVSQFQPAISEPNFVQNQQPQPSQKQKYTGNVSSNLQQPSQEPQTKSKYALIGYPLGHSLSGFIHDAGFKSIGIDASYEILETPPESLVDRIKFLKFNGYSGFNVTIPLKLPVTMFLDEVDITADIVNAVNTVVIDPQTRALKGYNTDVLGFKNAIPEDVVLAGKTCGILGTGGAARAAITALCQSQVKSIKLFTRNIPNCIELLNFLRSRFPKVEFNAFQIERIRDLSDIQILVNTTPIGMQGRAADLTPIEENELMTLPEGAVVYDVIYNPKKTVLLKLAQKHGYKTINGVDMFIHQALAAEQLWTGRTPDFKDMKIAALENL